MIQCESFSCSTSDGIAMGLQSVVLALVVCVILSGFYGKVRLEWPEKYTSITNIMEYKLRSGIFYYYILFRAIPVALLTLLVVVVLEREGGYPWAAMLLVLVVHLGFTNLKPAARLLLKSRWRAQPVVLLHHVLVTVVVLTSSLTVALFRSQLSFLIPTSESLIQALWAAFFIGILVFIVRDNAFDLRVSERGVVDRLISDIGEDSWRQTQMIPPKYSIDPHSSRPLFWRKLNKDLNGFEPSRI